MKGKIMATNQNDLERIIATIKAQAPQSFDAILSGPTVQGSQAKRPKPEKSSAGQTPNSGEVAFRIGVDGRRATAGLLADPYASRLVYLDKPFLIWKQGQYGAAIGAASELIDTQIAPSNSWARIKLYVEGTGGPSYSTQFGFYYFWSNDGPDPVVINIDTIVVITGYCFVQGSGGFLGARDLKSKPAFSFNPSVGSDGGPTRLPERRSTRLMWEFYSNRRKQRWSIWRHGGAGAYLRGQNRFRARSATLLSSSVLNPFWFRAARP
jgi:hypothetical protein